MYAELNNRYFVSMERCMKLWRRTGLDCYLASAGGYARMIEVNNHMIARGNK